MISFKSVIVARSGKALRGSNLASPHAIAALEQVSAGRFYLQYGTIDLATDMPQRRRALKPDNFGPQAKFLETGKNYSLEILDAPYESLNITGPVLWKASIFS